MVAIMILAISTALLAQFGLFYWRAVIAGIAAQPLSLRVRQAAGITNRSVDRTDFGLLLGLDGICPNLDGSGQTTGPVKLYYQLISVLEQAFNAFSPSLAAWAQGELATCARYMAVVVDRRLQHNHTSLVQISSY